MSEEKVVNPDYYVAIMAGGIGSRFWPQSRTAYPKQFLDILNTGKTLIQWTFERFAQFVPKQNIYVVTAAEYSDICAEQLPEIPLENIIAEPSRKNTAPCVAYISFKLFQKNPNACLVVAPSDHMIADTDTFIDIANKALSFVAENQAFVTLGIQPTHPNTGYGYIQFDQDEQAAPSVFKVKTFTEKPNLELAKKFLESGDFLWNGGIFIWKAKDVIEGFRQHDSDTFDLFDAEKEFLNTPSEKEVIEKIYPLCKNVAVDVALMEKAENVYVIPASFGWTDLGTWTSAYDNIAKDSHNNALASENVVVIEAKNCMVSAPSDKLLVLHGLDDYIVIDTKDALLICKKDKEQAIKEFVSEVKRQKGERYL